MIKRWDGSGHRFVHPFIHTSIDVMSCSFHLLYNCHLVQLTIAVRNSRKEDSLVAQHTIS
jgi:hypothetical protein